MILKCFGGRHSDQHVHVDDYLKLGDHWRLPLLEKFGGVYDYQEQRMLPAEIELDEYILEALRTQKIEVKFLRHITLSMETILLKVFT